MALKMAQQPVLLLLRRVPRVLLLSEMPRSERRHEQLRPQGPLRRCDLAPAFPLHSEMEILKIVSKIQRYLPNET